MKLGACGSKKEQCQVQIKSRQGGLIRDEIATPYRLAMTIYLDTTMMLADFFDVSVDREKLIQYADRILYGSDYPHIPYSMEREVRAILEMDLGEEVTRKIFYENAKKLFPIKLG